MGKLLSSDLDWYNAISLVIGVSYESISDSWSRNEYERKG